MTNSNGQIAETSMETYLNGCRLKMGETIREIREKKGYSQEQLADIMKVSRTTISKIESGKFNCSIDYLSKFSWFLGFEVTIKDFKNNSKNI
ncbi:helix-turn-helix transcriptional regulator [Flavobacterium sp.]|uniref:helix-turn-helix transcriptional regulator n=1 Tax=Flavobacterium sp. TaxID=239 RepID=UPI00286B027B|nr:helix-turn-helix transcriptional regulator [Flavobacterium sp.]